MKISKMLSKFMKHIGNEAGMASFYSTLTTSLQTTGAIIPAVNNGAKVKIYPFQYTFLTGGGSAPKVFLSKVPPGYYMNCLFFQTDGLSLTTTTGLTVTITDGTTTFLSSQAADAATSLFKLPLAAFQTKYTVDTWIYAQVNTGKTPVTGKSIWGFFLTADVS